MVFRSREDQSFDTGLALRAFSILPGQSPDSYFDTPSLPRPMRALNWLLEADVHQAVKVTDKLRNSNQFVGTQTMVVRDEVRRKTHLIAIESDGLFLYSLSSTKIMSSRQLSDALIKRAHLCLRKFDGTPITLFVKEESGQRTSLHLNDRAIRTESEHVDFPFAAIRQPPIGFPAVTVPEQGVIFYKCRRTNKIFARSFDPMTLDVSDREIELAVSNPVGGVDAEWGDGGLLLRTQTIEEDRIRTLITRGHALSELTRPRYLDMSGAPAHTEHLSHSPVTIDHTGSFHVPMSIIANDGVTSLLDALPDDNLLVECARVTDSIGISAIVAFPRMPGITDPFRLGFGDGRTDGNGMIATIASRGRLLVSNSQSGGYSYPEATHLNYDMQGIHAFRSTPCYTRGNSPNIVSMDYAFVEADGDGKPLSAELWIDTWDMPLPEPLVTHQFDGSRLIMNIEKDGWFFHGQTSFEIDPANTFITKFTLDGFRTAILEFDQPNKIPGCTVTFETKNAFYFHKGSARIPK